MTVKIGSRTIALFALLLGAACPLIASVPEHMTVGVQGSGSLVLAILRLLIGAWGAVLLLMGRDRPRWAVATVAASLTLALGLGLMWGRPYLLGLALTGVLLAMALALDTWLPRLGLALASWWPLAAVYAVTIYLQGYLDANRGVMLGLVLAGVTLAACLPRIGATILGVGCGTALILVSLWTEPTFPLLYGLITLGLILQIVVLPRVRGALGISPTDAPMPESRGIGEQAADQDDTATQAFEDPSEPPSEPAALPRTRLQAWRLRASTGLAVLLGGAVLMVALAPHYSFESVPDPSRLNALLDDADVPSHGLVLTPESNLYLSGTAYPIAVVSRGGTVLDRMAVLGTGASQGEAVRGLRGIKTETELGHLRQAARITSETFAVIEPMIRAGVSEAQVDEAIRRSFRDRGATGLAFPSVVGSGANAVIPHYQRNDQIMREGLVVIDIGCMVSSYASDMTRTFVVNGEPTAAELHLLDLVARAVDASRKALGPGTTMRDVEQAARDVLDEAGFDRFFTHSIGHHVGLNVHDPHQQQLEPGMVVTIEPGLYIPDDSPVDASYWDLGVRLEDTYLVTDEGWEMLTDYPLLPAQVAQALESADLRDLDRTKESPDTGQ
jgi:MFS family permease